MKYLLTITFLITFLAASDSFAEMGHGMMRETEGGTIHEHMMNHEEITGNMPEMMNELSGLMGDMSKMMKDIPKDRINNMSSIMKDMCFEMGRMAEIMDKGISVDKELKAMHDRIMDIRNRITGIKE